MDFQLGYFQQIRVRQFSVPGPYRRLVMSPRLSPTKTFAYFTVKTITQPRSAHLQLRKSPGHPGSSQMYATSRRTYYWPHMYAYVALTFRNFVLWTQNQLRLRKRTQTLEEFTSMELLDFVAIYHRRPLPNTKNGNCYLLLITYIFFKLLQEVPLKKKEDYATAVAFVHDWVLKYGPQYSYCVITSPNWQAKLSKVFVQNLMWRTRSHPLTTQTQMVRPNAIIAHCSRCFVSM